MEKLPHSYHTFMFPFIWKNNFNSNRKKFESDDFASLLDETYWKEAKYKPGEEVTDDPEIMTQDDERIRFAAIQYFHKPVLAAMFPSGTQVVRTFSFLPGELRNVAKYIIRKRIDNNGEVIKKMYTLNINGIRLKIYNTGVAALIIEAENFDYEAIEDIKYINDYGRRISLPFIPAKQGKQLTADCIGIVFYDKNKKKNDKENAEQMLLSEFDKDIIDLLEGNWKIEDYLKTMGIASTLSSILFYGKNLGQYEINTCFLEMQSNDQKPEEKKQLFLQPILDDRMFVACLIRNDKLKDQIQYPEFSNDVYEKWRLENGEDDSVESKEAFVQEDINCNGYAYQRIQKVEGSVAGEMYSIISIDPDDPSCLNRFMLHELVDKAVYPRWIEWGTVHAVTHQSLLCITGERSDVVDSVINPFLSQYIEMVLLVLIQRSTIIQFEHIAADLSVGIGKEKTSIEMDQIVALMDLQESFIAFQNELLFFEVTSQEQGIELYNLMQKQLYIDEEIEKLNQHLNVLYEGANVNQDYRFNKWALILALMALAISALTAFVNPVFNVDCLPYIIIVPVILILCGLYANKNFRRNK